MLEGNETVESALANIKRIGEILFEAGVLNEAEVIMVSQNIMGTSKFFGKEALETTKLTQAQLDQALLKQAQLKAGAAVIDIESIAAGKTLALPNWKKPHWGNGPVNKIIDNPSQVDSASAAANIAELIVLLVNQIADPTKRVDIATEVKEAVIAASGLAMQQLDGLPIVAKALTKVAAENLVNPEITETYINNRYHDIVTGVTMAMPEASWTQAIDPKTQQAPGQSKGL